MAEHERETDVGDASADDSESDDLGLADIAYQEDADRREWNKFLLKECTQILAVEPSAYDDKVPAVNEARELAAVIIIAVLREEAPGDLLKRYELSGLAAG